jgi:tRNA threonylcarbamoyladenosine biosynthesis protein TsaE
VPITAATTAVSQTRELAAAVAELARAGDLVLLVGDLGAGKTAFAQGFGAALGIDGPITSPTFTLARQYEGRLVLNHLDVYRLEQLEETLSLGLQELLDGQSVTLVEWGDMILPALPPDYLEVRLSYGIADDDRLVELLPVGGRWSARSRALVAALGPWLADVNDGAR